MPTHPQTTAPKNLAEWLAHCEGLHTLGTHGIELDLERVHQVAQRLQLSFTCPVITVAGTNGKGSGCAMLEAIYSQAGYRTGVYTSPHLLHFEERCRIANLVTDTATLLAHFAAVEATRTNIRLTYFEFTTLAILRCLSQAPLDIVILEVGLGGRLDAVNIIDADCALITNVDIDHTDFLGHTREQIGFEKAGIARPGKPLILGESSPPQSVLEHAASIGAQVWQIEQDYTFVIHPGQWLWRTLSPHACRIYSGLAHPALRGANQLYNASAVLAVLHVLHAQLPVSAQAIRSGLALTSLPGRFQVLAGQPAVVLDVAHNPHAAQTLMHNLDTMGFYPNTHAVFGCMRDKDCMALLRELFPLITHWHFCDLPVSRAIKAQGLLQIWQSLGKISTAKTSCYSSPGEAFASARSLAQSADRIVVFGSFYTVSGVLQAQAANPTQAFL